TITGVYNAVTGYYAKGDGETDDTLAIQRAINDASVKGGTVYLQEGTYICSSLTIPGNVKLIGDVQKNTILKQTGNHLTFISLVGDNIFIENIKLDGKKIIESIGINIVADTKSVLSPVIKNCIINGFN